MLRKNKESEVIQSAEMKVMKWQLILKVDNFYKKGTSQLFSYSETYIRGENRFKLWLKGDLH